MDKVFSEKIIQSLVHVTRHTDKELLEISLANTLFELLDIEKVILYNIYYNEHRSECYCSLVIENENSTVAVTGSTIELIDTSTIPGFDQCMSDKEKVTSNINKDTSTILFPIMDLSNKIVNIFRIERSVLSAEINETFLVGYFQIYKNYLNLLNESERDTLTGLLNRKTFDRDLLKILTLKNTPFTEADRYNGDSQRRENHNNNTGHWLAVADIDFFKRVNDTYGHLYGDEVLLLLSNIIRESFRKNDLLFRFGGEEFVLILRLTTLEGAQQALERFRLAIEQYDFPRVGKVTVSIGFVEITERSIPSEIMGFADLALYYSKENGRNQLHQYEKLIDNGLLEKSKEIIDDIELF